MELILILTPTNKRFQACWDFVKSFIKCAWRLFGARCAVQVQINKKDTSCLWFPKG